MNPISLLNWMLLSTVLLGAWWLCYHLALRAERSFAYNRAFLGLGPLLAAGLPLLPLSWLGSWGSGATGLPGMTSVLLPAVRVGTSSVDGTNWSAVWLLYLAGAAFVLLRLVWGLGQLWLSTRSMPAEQHPGYHLRRTGGRLPTSSFGRVVLWDETLALSAAEARQVLRHELAHIRQGHSYDRLLLELLRALLWFNPFVHLCGRALALTHEFLADAEALRTGPALASSAASYTHLLARQVAARLGFSVPLAHSFSQSLTLRRIAMINQTNPVRRWKQWLALPLLSGLLLTVACERTAPPAPPRPPDAPAAPNAPAPPPPPPVPVEGPPKASASGVYTYAEQMPELPSGGGNAAIVDFIQRKLVHPSGGTPRSGQVFVQFVVSAKGQVRDVTVVKGLAPDYDAAVVAAVQQLPPFTPGRQNGKAVAVSFTVPVLFAPAATGK